MEELERSIGRAFEQIAIAHPEPIAAPAEALGGGGGGGGGGGDGDQSLTEVRATVARLEADAAEAEGRLRALFRSFTEHMDDLPALLRPLSAYIMLT